MSLRTVIWLVLIGSSILILIEYLYRKNKAGKMQKEAIRARWESRQRLQITIKKKV